MDCLVAALEAMRLGSFTAAAEALGVTHAAISRRVAGAESWAGLKLFERHGRGVRPTPDGQRLLSRLSQSFDQIEGLLDRSHRPMARKIVRVGVTPSFARFWLLPRLVILEGEDVRVEIIADQRNADLEVGEVDIAIRYGRGGWRAGSETPLFNEGLCPIGTADLKNSFESVGQKQLLNLPLLHSGDTFLWREFAKLRNWKFRTKAADRVLPDYAATIDAAALGLGIALWNQSLHELPVGLNTLQKVEPEKSSLSYFLLQRKGAQSEPTEALIQRILAQATTS